VVTDPEVDAVVIGTWPYTHCTMVVAALQNNKHVMTEARMAMNATEAEQMLAESQLHPDLTCQIVPSPMTLKWDKTIQRLLAERAVGELLAVTVKSNGGPIDTQRPIMWREQYEISGMNTMGMGIFYEGVRCVVWCHYIFRIESVTSLTATRCYTVAGSATARWSARWQKPLSIRG
jgi:predicted dehydrogenase